MLHLVGLLSSYFAHDARSQKPKAYTFGFLCQELKTFPLIQVTRKHLRLLCLSNCRQFSVAKSHHPIGSRKPLGVASFQCHVSVIFAYIALDRTKRKLEKSGFVKSRLYCNRLILPVGPRVVAVERRTLKYPRAMKPPDASPRIGHRIARLAS